MRAMVLDEVRTPLQPRDLPDPAPARGQILVRVHACAVCRTDLHVVDGDLPALGRPVVPGHQIVGRVARLGDGVDGLTVGDRVGLPWLGWTCGECAFCRRGEENLCDRIRFTGYHLDGGFAELAVADARFALPILEGYPDLEVAPLLCGGLIGYRAYRMAGEAKRLGFYGFGAAAHIIAQLAHHEGREVYAFTRPGDAEAAACARELNAVWAGGSDEDPPVALDAAVIFAPVGPLVPRALAHLRPGGIVVCAGIHMSDIPAFPYRILWGERSIRSVANLTRRDGREFLALAPQVPVRTEVHPYPLEEAGRALEDLRRGRFTGSAVLVVDEDRLVR